MLIPALALTALVGLSALMVLSAAPTAAAGGPAAEDNPTVVLDTTLGPITVELDGAKSPISTENFLKYVDKGFYDNVTFHRVIPGFMVQTGGMSEGANGVMTEKRSEAFPPIRNESQNGLKNARGTLAMARTSNPDSATSQFFINLVDNANLNPTRPGTGYAVFGRVVDGMEVVDKIAKAETGVKRDSFGNPHENVPTTPILIKSAKRKPKS